MAAVGGNEIQLTFSLELEVALDLEQLVIRGTEPVQTLQGSRGVKHRSASIAIAAAETAIQGLVVNQALDDLDHRLLTLALNGDVHAGLLQAFQSKHGWMPAAPNHRNVWPTSLGVPGNLQRIDNRSPRQHADTQTYGAIQMSGDCLEWIFFQPAIDDDDFI